jgi:hypothetical protein
VEAGVSSRSENKIEGAREVGVISGVTIAYVIKYPMKWQHSIAEGFRGVNGVG